MTVGTLPIWSKTFSYAIRSLCFLHIVHMYAYEFTETRGESMLPTLSATNDYVHVLKNFQNGRGIKMGDCIVALKPTDPNHRICKRVTGMPGDLVLVDPSTIVNYVGDVLVDEERFGTYIKVPEGHVWVTGDNLSHSLDSRTYNALPMGLIMGKIVAANNFDKPFWDGSIRNIWGFKWITNTFLDVQAKSN
ncbi:Imp1p [Saccharomyces cerevisiae YJM1573]|uniref:Mitochondrial inner membrane protease subunit n=1 Tax=Saccharomyces cerevisiae (strain YJM789) TaxID=307796 RepID=A6ZMK9_YEAS7|nr:Imp1p [Saccharomyces cerevisiae YJM195]AJS65066.1 Imp1p [Saccharomyces cerevisiae YJM320]AJS65503.1 Imp1p [Saccharomyces cerevisiae YJM326]AJS65936.1 Imp1p [Saccharomyces cerevisiae YJM428]AJS66814.1 Imp1p [Saccharomyces cerevisiae YJM451]AJS67691.1 Imp1p [Saccharomyces cerevisiae YJM456]AJS69006.1 Imp1p [Saccharomyces cerevisiae YJM554]AJS69443.1 Imp1p [Saccharomyces cerevisiae YJM555]AJS70319.1 Imp1p [Saccharomyces cerevisiae YJM681]AJS70761.1 Imp1p [Saccharomyces cerevisiae YJM682]A